MTLSINRSGYLDRANPVVPRWEVISRFTKIFQCTIQQDDYPAACGQAFELALAACQQRHWDRLGAASSEILELVPQWGTSLLNQAVIKGEDEWTKQLLKHNVAIHSTDLDGNTPLHTAAIRGACHLIHPLCAHIDLEKKNKHAETPLHVAIRSGHDAFVVELMKRGASVNSPIPIHNRQLVLDPLGLAVMHGQKKCISALIQSVRSNYSFSYQGLGSLLHVAIHFDQYEALEYLLSQHKSLFSDLEIPNQDGLTPLCFAAALGQRDMVNLLCWHGASVHARDVQGRSPMHHAANGHRLETIQLLAALGAAINPSDSQGVRPLDLVEGRIEGGAQSCCSCLKNLIANKQSPISQPRLQPPENLVFRGGGAKGLAFVGALSVLDAKNLLRTVERVAGTSAGAITAALVAVDYPIEKLKKLLKDTDLIEVLLDHPFTKEKLKAATQDLSRVWSVFNACLNPLNIVVEPLKALYRCTGVCDGEKFREWIEEIIATQTGIPFLTFGELAQCIKEGRPYKHLHVYGTRVGNDPKVVPIHSNDSAWHNVIISDAVRLSMSIPGVFKPHIIHIKAQGRRIAAPEFGSFLDGGMLYNFPLETFDQKQFCTRKQLSGDEGERPKYNERTLGLSLYSSLENRPTDPNTVTNSIDLLKGIFSIYMNAEESIRQLNPYHASRIIQIDVRDVGALSFHLADPKKEEMVGYGEQAMKSFLTTREMAKHPALDLPLLGVTGLSIYLRKGLNLVGTCKNSACSEETVYLRRGMGDFNIVKEWSEAKCPCCNQRLEVKNFGFWDCGYSIQSPQLNRSEQIAPSDCFLTSDVILGDLVNSRFSYLNVHATQLP